MKNLESIYDKQINPLMKQIISICKENNLPMFATFLFSDRNIDDEDDAKGCTTTLNFNGDQVITDCHNIIYKDYEAVPKHRFMAMTMITSNKEAGN